MLCHTLYVGSFTKPIIIFFDPYYDLCYNVHSRRFYDFQSYSFIKGFVSPYLTCIFDCQKSEMNNIIVEYVTPLLISSC